VLGKQLGLKSDSSVDVIEKDPRLFQGTVRDNLDPKSLYSEDFLIKFVSKLISKFMVEKLVLMVVEENWRLSSLLPQLTFKEEDPKNVKIDVLLSKIAQRLNEQKSGGTSSKQLDDKVEEENCISEARSKSDERKNGSQKSSTPSVNPRIDSLRVESQNEGLRVDYTVGSPNNSPRKIKKNTEKSGTGDLP
jgi:hypothetical protein